MALSILQAGIDRRVQIDTVDIDGKFKINAVSNDIFKIQKVDGSLLYDDLELSVNNTDKTSILQINNVYSLASLNLKASATNVYTKQEINNTYIIYVNALNNKADKTHTYLKTEIDTKLAALPVSSVDLGGIFRLSKSSDNNTFSIDRYSLSQVNNAMAWMSLYSIVYDVNIMHCRLILDKTDMFDMVNNKLNNTTGNASMAIKNNNGFDVAVFYNSKAYISNNLSVLDNIVLGNILTVRGNGYNGTIKCVPLVDTGESSLVFV